MSEILVVPLDGSEFAESALPLATAVAGRTGAEIRLVHVRRMVQPDAQPDEARAYMEHACDHAASAGVRAKMVLIPDDPAELLQASPAPGTVAAHVLEYAGSVRASLIVMATHGRGGFSRMWFGSVADALLRTSTLPLLLAPRPPNKHADPRVARVLIALAGDDPADAIVHAAQRFTAAFRPHYTLLRIIAPGYVFVGDAVPGAVVVPGFDPEREKDVAEQDLRRHADVLDASEIDMVTQFDPTPAPAILRHADEHDIDIIVVGTHQRRGFDRLMLGSVADKVVRGAECGVLVVPADSPAPGATEWDLRGSGRT